MSKELREEIAKETVKIKNHVGQIMEAVLVDDVYNLMLKQEQQNTELKEEVLDLESENSELRAVNNSITKSRNELKAEVKRLEENEKEVVLKSLEDFTNNITVLEYEWDRGQEYIDKLYPPKVEHYE